jgi:farnesyl diphosphate synthase
VSASDEPRPIPRSKTNIRGRSSSFAKDRARVERMLRAAIPNERAVGRSAVVAAMREAALGGGKRLRPVFVLRLGEMLGSNEETLRGLCLCVELLHTASFILDDLPCMDGAYERRGRPPLHLQFDEATAILAANALLVLAFEKLATDSPGVPTKTVAELVTTASRAVGVRGMISGQHEDLTRLGGNHPRRRTFEHVQRQKTGSLFEFAARAAARIAGARLPEVHAVARFAMNLGIAFQMTDDILAATKSPRALGKGSRHDTGKSVLKTPFDLAWARGTVDRWIDEGIALLAPFGSRAAGLREIAELVRARAHA